MRGARLAGEVHKTEDFRDGMPFLGGAQWLDLANSSFTLDGNAFDFLADVEVFSRWARAAGFDLEPGTAEPERLAALELRDTARAILADLAAGHAPGPAQITSVNRLLDRKTTGEQLVLAGSGVALQARATIAGPRVATTLASDLAHFLSDYEPLRLKSCDNPTCKMVFYDRGKNNRRRWCTMAICGNRDKIANYRARKAAAVPLR